MQTPLLCAAFSAAPFPPFLRHGVRRLCRTPHGVYALYIFSVLFTWGSVVLMSAQWQDDTGRDVNHDGFSISLASPFPPFFMALDVSRDMLAHSRALLPVIPQLVLFNPKCFSFFFFFFSFENPPLNS